ncbi:hypothetical protein [Streptomyces sp. CB03911]|uniref:hypothetical protein n=1 Tax=Streptomyces sp. CB03911 TaxID=1804758 RepID=UPI00093923F1|nr:hypothetical protein [Streptomyces sp. CB03911]OKI16608.1 hypothetical protein A6A07_11410 [Streptomyces sp. CB03911]
MEHNVITLDGQPYPTRNNPPRPILGCGSRDLYNLPDDQYRRVVAIHEAGHAIAHLAGGNAHLIHASISDDLDAEITGTVKAWSYDLHAPAAVITDCAGERAVDKWLHLSGLWTDERAIAAEIGARSDRALALNVPGMTQALLRGMHTPTDDLLAAHWPSVEAVAEALISARHLTGDQVARITGLSNRARPAITHLTSSKETVMADQQTTTQPEPAPAPQEQPTQSRVPLDIV